MVEIIVTRKVQRGEGKGFSNRNFFPVYSLIWGEKEVWLFCLAWEKVRESILDRVTSPWMFLLEIHCLAQNVYRADGR